MPYYGIWISPSIHLKTYFEGSWLSYALLAAFGGTRNDIKSSLFDFFSFCFQGDSGAVLTGLDFSLTKFGMMIWNEIILRNTSTKVSDAIILSSSIYFFNKAGQLLEDT